MRGYESSEFSSHGKARTSKKLAPDILREYGNGNEHYEKYEGHHKFLPGSIIFLKAEQFPADKDTAKRLRAWLSMTT
ncbi:MAG: hypothetical protein ACLRSW_11190 [Christensenellaceae bacterium]